MTTIFIHKGDTIDFTPDGADVAAGDVIVQEELVGVANRAILDGQLGGLHVKGVIDFPKATGGATEILAGKLVFWDAGAVLATETTAGNTLIGKSVLLAGDDDVTVRVRMDQ